MSDSQFVHTYRTYSPVSRHSELTLSLLVSRVRLADDIQVPVMSLAGFPSDNLAVLASLLYRTVNLHAASLLHQTVSECSRDGRR